MFKALALMFVIIFCAACSSIEKVTYYQFEKPKEQTDARLSYEPTTVHDGHASASGYPLKIIYKKKFRIFQVNQYQYARLTFVEYGNKTYTIGPLLLPIVPLFGWGTTERKVNMDANIAFSLSFSSDPIFETVTAQLPNLEIIDDDGKIHKPRVEEDSSQIKTFVYDAKIGETPWFILRAAEIKLSNGKVLKIPETKFELDSSLAVNLLIPIGP